MKKTTDIVDLLRHQPADEGIMEDAADEIMRLRTELGVANQIIYDLTDGITGTLQRDETDRLRGHGQTPSGQ